MNVTKGKLDSYNRFSVFLTVRGYLESHGSLQFLGLSLTKACEYSMFSVESKYGSELIVSIIMNQRSCLLLIKWTVCGCFCLKLCLLIGISHINSTY